MRDGDRVMRIKLAVLNHDAEFIKRLSEIFRKKYSEVITLTGFSDNEVLYKSVEELKPDIILFDEADKIDQSRLPQKVICGFICEEPDVNSISSYPVVFKYQKVDKIYQDILNLYESIFNEDMISGLKESGSRIILFTSAQGGCGTSVAAASYALRCAKDQKKVIYIGLDNFGNSNLYFLSDNDCSFSDVIHNLQEQKGDLFSKIKGLIQEDLSGVHFFNPCRNACDMIELRDEDLFVLLYNLAKHGTYDEIIIDYSCTLNVRTLELMKNYSDKIVYVTDGSVSGADKFQRFCGAVREIEDRDLCNIIEKTVLLYNRFTANSRTISESIIPEVAGILYYEDNSEKELVERIAALDSLTRI